MEHIEHVAVASTVIERLVKLGYEEDSIRDYMKTGDLDKLKHTGRLVSVDMYCPDARPETADVRNDEDIVVRR